jgi:putative nucleotidyltransferase with HDIG domain
MSTALQSLDSRTDVRWMHKLAEVNRELWLILSLFVISALINWVLSGHGVILSLYMLPTLFSAYMYGRTHAVCTALASILLVVILALTNPTLLSTTPGTEGMGKWFELMAWSGILLVVAYAMGTMYDRKEAHMRELRRTYFGVLTILQQVVSNDKYTHNHSYRVAFYAASICGQLGFSDQRVDDVRAAALLHDIGKLETSREILYKASALTPIEMEEMRKHVRRGTDMLQPIGGPLNRVIPIILAHHERHDGSGYEAFKGEEIPIEARVLALADAYDTLTSDRPYRRAVTSFEARQLIVAGAGTNFDPKVVDAFVAAFDARQMELPESLAI